jgi:hypothetical protein
MELSGVRAGLSRSVAERGTNNGNREEQRQDWVTGVAMPQRCVRDVKGDRENYREYGNWEKVGTAPGKEPGKSDDHPR